MVILRTRRRRLIRRSLLAPFLLAGLLVTPTVATAGLIQPAHQGELRHNKRSSDTQPSTAATDLVCPSSTRSYVDDDGDSHREYTFANGTQLREVYPNPSLDPLTASAARLSKFPWPVRPSRDSADYAEWAAEFGKSSLLKESPGEPCMNPTVKFSVSPSSFNYSGYAAQAAAGTTFDQAHTSYTAPNYYLSTCRGEAFGDWVGVSNDTVLMQSGVFVNQTSTLQSGGFVEVVGGPFDTGAVVQLPIAYTAGQRYYFYIGYRDANDLYYIVQNLDTGLVRNGFLTNTSGGSGGATGYRQPIGYFIDERPTVGNSLSNFMDHSVSRFRSATVHITGGTDARMSIERPQDISMYNYSYQLLGYTTSFDSTSSSFSGNWNSCN